MNELNDAEKQEAINAKINQHWGKMIKDSKQISTTNYEIYGRDLLNYCLLDFMDKKSINYQYQVAVVDDKLPNYMGRSMSLQMRSSTSPFWLRYRREGYNSRGSYLIDEEIDNTEQITFIDENFDLRFEEQTPLNCIQKAVEELDFYNKALITEYYYNNLTFKEINEKYNIPISSIMSDTKKALKIIKSFCNQFNL